MAILAARELAQRERRTAKALLRVERRSLKRATHALQHVTELVAITPAPSTVRQYTPAAHATVARELLHARQDARAAGRDRFEADIGEQSPVRIGVLDSADEDEAASFVAAAGVTGAWGMAALAAIAAGTNVAKISKVIAPNLERSVVTESATAFNDERNHLFGVLGEMLDDAHDEAGKPKGVPPAGMFKVYSAILDRVTCRRCFAADGEVVELQASFQYGDPPLHPRCRCIIEHAIIPRPERLEDIAFDYNLFKEELADVIREGREISDRRALSFVSDSQGDKRSPVALTKRFANEPYATRR